MSDLKQRGVALGRKQNKRGEEAFHRWYEAHWGERWAALVDAMAGPRRPVALWNPHCGLTPAEALPPEAHPWPEEGLDSAQWPLCWVAPQIPPPPLDRAARPAYYILDSASILAAAACRVEPGDDVLDMCAAPGGKSLFLAAALGVAGQLTANELSRARYERLKRVLHGYLPPSWRDDRLRLTRYDASRWCLYEQERYHKILLDVPCSSEHHLLHSPKDLARWSPARSKQLAIRQYALLASALEVVEIGGWITYSTCSVSPLECDQIIARLHKKRSGRFQLAPPPWTHGEDTAFGRWLLPDRGEGWGPIYVATLQRIA